MHKPWVVWVVMWAAVGPVWANGMLIPKDGSLPPLGVKHQRVQVTVENQVATTRVEQVFFNSTSRDLEATYVFPLPGGAAVRDFALWIGGKRTQAELLEAGKARKIYTDIVRRAKDPGLLEYMGHNLVRVRVYPVPKQGDQKIELSYAQLLKADGGVVNYRYPLRTGRQVSQTLKDFTLTVDIQSRVPIKSVYCPSHQNVAIRRRDDHQASVSFEKTRYMLDRDFDLYYTVSAKDVGLHLIARRDTDAYGHFMLLVSPRAELGKLQLVPQDVVFVLDTSGSMSGEKIKQARQALAHCVQALRAEDRFNLVRFATDVETCRKDLTPVDAASVQAAVAWIGKLEPSGGTNIDEALQTALGMKRDPNRPFTVVFLTDGLPTIGVTQPKRILDNVKARNTANTRVFVFGVGDDVNTHLLDQLADLTRATSQYVRQTESVEQKVSGLFGKVRHPVLVNLALSVDKVRLVDLYPKRLPDLFHGSQLVVLGRYDGAGRANIKLTGRIGQKQCVFAYQADFPQRDPRHEFVETLWARRKVGHLLDQIRLHGEQKELKDEVIALGKKYGIASPYMSYLVVEDKAQPAMPLARAPARRQTRVAFRFGRLEADGTSLGGRGGTGGAPRRRSAPMARRTLALERAAPAKPAQPSSGVAAAEPVEAEVWFPDDKQWGERTRKRQKYKVVDLGVRTQPGRGGRANTVLFLQSGRDAVDLAERLRELKDASRVGEREARAVKRVAGKTFLFWHGVWIDRDYAATLKRVTVEYLGDTYLKILAARPEWKTILALGDRLVVVTPSRTVLVIGPKEDKPLTDAQVAALFVPAKAQASAQTGKPTTH